MLDVGVEQPEGREEPGAGGTTTRRISSARAMAAAKSGPLPPKANSANSRGSRPRSLETARIARIMLAAAMTCAP